jgi:hypothetical protein
VERHPFNEPREGFSVGAVGLIWLGGHGILSGGLANHSSARDRGAFLFDTVRVHTKVS